jgi:hypothetical protein
MRTKEQAKIRRKKTGPQAGFLRSSLPYWLAPDAGAAIAPEADASEAGADIADDADVSAGADAGATTAAGAEAEVSAAGAAWSLLLLHAASAKAAIREATRRDFFMITSFYG